LVLSASAVASAAVWERKLELLQQRLLLLTAAEKWVGWEKEGRKVHRKRQAEQQQ
jgi:hypothetical protein